MSIDLLKQNNLCLNLGCGEDIKNGFVNCDIQRIDGVDLVMDCADLSRFRDESVSLLFCHSFFEHLYRYQHIPFLQDCFRILDSKGVLVLLGIPDFEEIARCYLSKRPGLNPFGGTFNSFQVYRLTHGDFEEDHSASIPQLHKDIFDKKILKWLFDQSGFNHFKIFNYKFPREQYPLALAVMAWKDPDIKLKTLKKTLALFSSYFGEAEEVLNNL